MIPQKNSANYQLTIFRTPHFTTARRCATPTNRLQSKRKPNVLCFTPIILLPTMSLKYTFKRRLKSPTILTVHD